MPSDAFCRSRQILKVPGTRIRAHLVGDFAEPAALSEIGINLPVPGSIIARSNKCGEFHQFLRGQGLNSILDFGKAHGTIVSARTAECDIR